MDRRPFTLPLPLPLPRPGEAIVATALAGALGVATWACMPFVMARGGLTPVVAVLVSALAFHWLWRGLPTAANSPERSLPATTTFRRIGAHGFLHAALAVATFGAVAGLTLPWGPWFLVRLAIGFAVGASLGVVVWGPGGLLAIAVYGMTLRAATGAMDAAYPDVVDRALVRTHRGLAMGAALPLILGVGGFLRAPAFDGLPSLALAVFVLLGGAAVAVPVRVALRARRRLAARKARIGNDLRLLPIAGDTADRLANLPILGDGAPPTHALVRVAPVEDYRVAATPEEPLALIAVATDISAKER